MTALLDVSALIALLDPDHAAHQTVNRWICDHPDEPWATCALTENGYIRIVSQPSYPNRLGIPLAVAALAAARGTPRHQFWDCELSIADPAAVHPNAILGPAQVTDTYLLALAVSRGGRFLTLDRRASTAAVAGAQAASLVLLQA
ncbi:MAG: hypothetical protein LBE08_13785 [Bifidobacteriaceae bacterium]|jgi:toxin-antitoxin system PIN domain toxin|nr:hypothetical protein [Bifidobacteriaceae bacterium]